ncbi:NAD(P)H-dependent flavin oxidoreductase [Zunongwangia sp.]|uniref:NAD(P)H-dependent flavin oxidoreductase n=1 Tax=Zunongwangia sp. TaxID=1965325 RepID=UPI003AA7BFC6
MAANKITELFNINYPIVQGGMVWTSGWRLAAAVSNAGGLGVIGAGSMYPELLREHIQKFRKTSKKSFGVNVPLLYPHSEAIMEVIIEEKVPIVFSSAGNPKVWTSSLQQHGIKVAHVVSSVKFALKAEKAGVDAIVTEGFEAGGHNGSTESTTLTLIPVVKQKISVPLIAAGGIATGRGMLAAMTLGADGVQIGSRFVTSNEASSHHNFKEMVVSSEEGDTMLTLKELGCVRLLKNDFYHQIQKLYSEKASLAEVENFLGKGRLRKGIFEGDLKEGKLEIGQISALISEIKPAAEIINEIIEEFNDTSSEVAALKF